MRDEPVEGLVRAARSGRREAFGALYERFAPYVHSILLARLRPDDAADLVQEVFLLALERLRSLREAAAFSGWLAAIARNCATDFLRHRTPTGDVDVEPAAGTAIEARLDAADALDAIRRLPEAYRETLLLRLVEGLTGPEIAELTGLTPASVRVNLHRGFRLLRQCLGRSS